MVVTASHVHVVEHSSHRFTLSTLSRMALYSGAVQIVQEKIVMYLRYHDLDSSIDRHEMNNQTVVVDGMPDVCFSSTSRGLATKGVKGLVLQKLFWN